MPAFRTAGARLAPNDNENLRAFRAPPTTKRRTEYATVCDNSPSGLVIHSPLWIDRARWAKDPGKPASATASECRERGPVVW